MKEKITSRQLMLLVFIFLISNCLMQGYNEYAKSDSFIAVIIGGLSGILNCFMIYRLTVLFPEMGLYEILSKALGKTAAFIIMTVYSIAALFTGAGYIKYMLDFVRVFSLDTDILLPFTIMITLVVIYFSKQTAAGIGRFIQLIFPVIGILLLVIFAVGAFGISYSPLPLFKNGADDFMLGALDFCLMPYGTLFLLFPFFKSCEGLRKRTLMIPTALSALILSAAFILTVMILGYPTVEMMRFPSYMALSAVHISRFFERIEIAGFVVFIICHIVKTGAAGIFFTSFVKTKGWGSSIIFAFSVSLGAFIIPFDKINPICERAIYPVLFLILPVFIYFFAEIKQCIIAKRNKI